uniref:PTS system mannose/fructose/sorbose family transporter subunit IID n=1 Tax=Thaumasiovibrio occultus TaxID=1891184 RepID=UPI000B355994|nr:PTS system mannose/fructose/sorbose family transporter subunit IID [Thaumasiovibrio occultus]
MSNMNVAQPVQKADAIDQLDKQVLRDIFMRSNTLELSFNYEKMQALGFCYSITPALKAYYGEDDPRFTDALERNMALFNITPAMSPFVLGVAASLEKEASKNPEMENTIVNNIKSSLMAPLSGIGDSFFWGTFRIIAGGIGISMAQQGSIMGMLMFLLLFNIPNFVTRWFGLNLGFKLGTKLIDQMASGNVMDRINKIFGIVGLMCVGGMTATMVKLNLATEIEISGAVVNFQNILDQILPNLLPLGATLLCYRLIQKGYSVNKILVGIILFGIAGKAIGLL